MSANRSQFLPESDWKPESAGSSAVTLRQPLTPPYIKNNPGFGNKLSHSRPFQPPLPQYLAIGAGTSAGQTSGALPYSRDPFPAVSVGSQSPDATFYISNEQLDSCSSFALHRGGNVYTRLIPADRLPLLNGVAQTQGPEGLIILPNPRGISPGNRSGLLPDDNYQLSPSVIGDGRPIPRSAPTTTDPVQSRIDTIVTAAPAAPPKKVKIYCDKWLHDGTCAFTQQGCRFKHEMPLDRAMQIDLGLFNGLPLWYRRAQAADFRAGTNLFASAGTGAVNGGSVSDFTQGSAYGNSGAVVRRGGAFDGGMNWRVGNGGRIVTEPPHLTYPSESGGGMTAANTPRALTANGGRRSWALSPSAAAPYNHPRGVIYQDRLMSADTNDTASRNSYNVLYQYDEEDDGTDEV